MAVARASLRRVGTGVTVGGVRAPVPSTATGKNARYLSQAARVARASTVCNACAGFGVSVGVSVGGAITVPWMAVFTAAARVAVASAHPIGSEHGVGVGEAGDAIGDGVTLCVGSSVSDGIVACFDGAGVYVGVHVGAASLVAALAVATPHDIGLSHVGVAPGVGVGSTIEPGGGVASEVGAGDTTERIAAPMSRRPHPQRDKSGSRSGPPQDCISRAVSYIRSAISYCASVP